MTAQTNQRGFHVVELAVVVLVAAAVGAAGYMVLHRKDKDASTTSSQQVPAAPQINSGDDLTAASAAVDKLDLSTSSTDIDSLDKELDTLQ